MLRTKSWFWEVPTGNRSVGMQKKVRNNFFPLLTVAIYSSSEVTIELTQLHDMIRRGEELENQPKQV